MFLMKSRWRGDGWKHKQQFPPTLTKPSQKIKQDDHDWEKNWGIQTKHNRVTSYLKPQVPRIPLLPFFFGGVAFDPHLACPGDLYYCVSHTLVTHLAVWLWSCLRGLCSLWLAPKFLCLHVVVLIHRVVVHVWMAGSPSLPWAKEASNNHQNDHSINSEQQCKQTPWNGWNLSTMNSNMPMENKNQSYHQSGINV